MSSKHTESDLTVAVIQDRFQNLTEVDIIKDLMAKHQDAMQQGIGKRRYIM